MVDAETVTVENLLRNAFILEPHEGDEGFHRRWARVRWLWGSERGRASMEVRSVCNGYQVDGCTKDCSAYMDLGQAEIKCREPEDRNQLCWMTYSYAFATPLADINYENDGFTMKVTGLGSSAVGKGTLTAGCP